MEERNYVQLVKDKLSEEIYTRMEDDRKLFELDPYVMRGKNNVKVDDVINVTLSIPARLAAFVESALGNTEEEIVVTSDDRQVDTALIEDFIRRSMKAADDRSVRRGEPSMDGFFNQQLCRRGRAAARVMYQVIDGVLVPDIALWDTGFVASEPGLEDLAWGAYKVTKSKAIIDSEPWAIQNKYIESKKEAEVIEVWDEEKQVIYVAGNQILAEPHSFGAPPICIQGVSLGSHGANKESQKYRDESILLLVRGTIPEFNRLMSIMQTLAFDGMKPSFTWPSKDALAPPPEGLTPGTGYAIEAGNAVGLITYGQATQQATMVYQLMLREIQESGLTAIQIGNLEFTLSAVALIELGQSRDQIYRPRLKSKGDLKTSIAWKGIEQVIASGASKVEVGYRGHRRIFDVSKLEGEYQIEFKHYPNSPTTLLALITLANAAESWLDRQTILEETIRVRDPAKVMRRKWIDMAIANSPMLTMRAQIEAFFKEDRKEEANILATELGLTVDQILSGQVPQTQGQPGQPGQEGQKPQPEELLSLLGKPGAKGRSQPPQLSAGQLPQLPAGTQKPPIPQGQGK